MAGLAEAVHGAVGQPASVRVGVVDSTDPLAISAQGVPFDDVGLLGDYAPLVGDSVVLLGQCSEAGSDPASWLALGAAHGALTPSIVPVLLNGWVDFDPVNWASASYWRDASGVVHVEGLIRSGVTVAGTSLFVLPDGFRPSGDSVFSVVASGVVGRVDVKADGRVTAETVSAAFTSLSGISFRAMPYATVPA